jgi:hypothetical protein
MELSIADMGLWRSYGSALDSEEGVLLHGMMRCLETSPHFRSDLISLGICTLWSNSIFST